MHPAYSVILFTTASGAGYGLLVWLSVSALLTAVTRDAPIGWAGLGLAVAMILGGLMSSTAHLGRPERAWRGFSQWRSSWLSREAVLAVATFVPMAILGLIWVFGNGKPEALASGAALAAAVLAVATVWSTGMIYQSLPTIRAWHTPLVAPAYVVLGLASGLVIYYALMLAFGRPTGWSGPGALCLLAISALVKLEYWRSIDKAERSWTAGAATGLGSLGEVRVLEPPHTLPNFVMREMGYGVARKHAEKLRRLALIAGFVAPAFLVALSMALPQGPALVLTLLAVVAMAVGLFTERWLFFAEAQHVVTLYYGSDRA